MSTIQLDIHGKYTLIHISEMGISFKREFQVLDENGGDYVIQTKGERTRLTLKMQKQQESLLFSGHHLPMLIDSETNDFAGNARFNFVTDFPEQLRTYIVEQCLNLSDEKKAKIMFRGSEASALEGQPLFAEGEAEQ